MKYLVSSMGKIILTLFSAVFLVYLLLPNPRFPEPPSDSIQSQEEADTETPLRRAYFTDFTRQEVLKHYQDQFSKSSFLAIPLPTYRLNYPPEESQTLIRDQTRSTFLEEIVHPFRESLFVNGFEPKDPQDDVWYRGVDYRQKIIIRFVPSNGVTRVVVALPTLALFLLLTNEWVLTLRTIKDGKKKK